MRAKFFVMLILGGGLTLLLIASQGHSQPGRSGFSGSRGSFDPMARFEQYAKGRGFFYISEVTDDPSRQQRLTQYAQQSGITDGKITQQGYQGYIQQFMSGGFRGSSPGGGAPSFGSRPPSGGAPSGGPPSGNSQAGGPPTSGMMGVMGDPSQMFDRLSGGKNVIRRSDLADPMMQMIFDRMADRMGIKDGQITREQFTGLTQQFQAMRSGGNSGGPGGNSNDFDSEFRRRDRNGDGVLNYDEMSDTLRSEREKWDTNHDGFIELNEYKAYMTARQQQKDAERAARDGGSRGQGNPDQFPFPELPDDLDKKPTVYRVGNLPREIPSWFKELDADTDAQVGLYEWKSSGRSFDEFNRIDRNGDGFLTIDETLRYVGQLKAGGSGSPGEQTASRGPGGPSSPGSSFRGFGGPPSGGTTPGGSTPGSNGNGPGGSSDRRGPPGRGGR